MKKWKSKSSLRRDERETGSVRTPEKAAEPILNQPHLSSRQTEIVKLVSDGLSDCQIAARLGLSEDTVGSYLKTIFKLYDVHSRTDLARHWLTGDGTLEQ